MGVLAVTDAASLGLGHSGGSWLQTIGGLAVVFGLLLLFLRLLGRFNRRTAAGSAEVLGVWGLGPKREIQVLRLEDRVHYVYRHDGAMVVLKEDDLASFKQQESAAPRARNLGGMRSFLKSAARPRSAAGCPDTP